MIIICRNIAILCFFLFKLYINLKHLFQCFVPGSLDLNHRPWNDFSGLSNLEITVGKQKINCHKIMLAYRSPVFQRMFDSNMKENLENKLTIKDIDETTFLSFLHYLYQPDLEIAVPRLTIQLFRVAIKYLVSSLIQIFYMKFDKVMKKEIAIEFAMLLSQTNIHDGFLTKTMDYIYNNIREIKSCKNYAQLFGVPKLAEALVDRFLGNLYFL